MSPTQRTLAELKRRGWICQVVEKWNPHARIRQDLFGCIDIIAIVEGTLTTAVDVEAGSITVEPFSCLLGIQATSGANHASRREKMLSEPRAHSWMKAGGRLAIWSWAKKGPRGKRKTWQLREEAIAP